MWDRLLIVIALACVHAAGAPLSQCPARCECALLSPGRLEARCTSLHFLDALRPQQAGEIASLGLANLNLTRLPRALKKLHNVRQVNLADNRIDDLDALKHLPKLTHLNLRSNRIRSITNFPRHLKHIDLSRNQLTYIPQQLKALHSLKELNLNYNPISCDCDTLSDRDELIRQGVYIKTVHCHSPKSLKGQSLLTATCENDLDRMQGDEAIDGSGDEPETSEQNETEELFKFVNTANDTDIISEELIIQTNNKATAEDPEEAEGSGDDYYDLGETNTTESPDEEGSGSDDIIIPVFAGDLGRPRGCLLSACSTPGPLINDSDDASPAPGFIDGFKIVVEDISGKEVTTEEAIIKEEDVSEEVEDTDKIVPVVAIDLGTERLADHDESKKSDGIKVEPNTQTSSLNTTFLIVAALLAVMIGLVIYSVMKKRNARRRLPLRDNIKRESEMKPLKNEKSLNDKNIKSNDQNSNGGSGNMFEKVPLMNGQKNGKGGEEAALPHRPRPEDRDSQIPYADDEDDDVDLRRRDNDEDGLIPETHRVTIKVAELSAPKTPLLVNRQRIEDGTIITIPTQEESSL